MFEGQQIMKGKPEDRILRTNCYICKVSLKMDEVRTNPDNNGDKRMFCRKDYKKLFGKKRKLRKGY